MGDADTKVNMPFKQKQKNGTKTFGFGFYLSLVTSVLIALAIIVTVFYSSRCINLLMQDYTSSTIAYNNYVSISIVREFKLAREKNSYAEINQLVDMLKHNNYIKYAFAYEPKTGKILWASEPEFYNLNKEQIYRAYLYPLSQEGNIEEKDFGLSQYNFVLGLAKSKIQNDGYKQMIAHLRLFLIFFLIIALTISAHMSRQINKPLMNLVSGVQEFGEGNFQFRLKESGFAEIDKLASAYNHMAVQLYELYNSLETKVKERTIELEKANEKLKETQTMMVHSEKMRSLGELVAGIAHEINNPINFIYGNIMILDNYQKDLLKLIEKYTQLDSEIDKEHLQDINDFKEQIDIEFLKGDIGDLIKSCIEGVERTKNIILNLKNFSRMDEMVFSECNIPKEIDTTLSILNNKIKNRITVHKNYEENLPKIEAYGGQLNQVFMNILDNAQGAIKDKGDIYITTKRYDEKNIIIEFEDTGCGIKQENLNKIFEPFFTTKPVGQGTGLGMSISYKVIQSHNGKISAESEVGKGTKITVILPIQHEINNKTKEQDKETANG